MGAKLKKMTAVERPDGAEAIMRDIKNKVRRAGHPHDGMTTGKQECAWLLCGLELYTVSCG